MKDDGAEGFLVRTEGFLVGAEGGGTVGSLVGVGVEFKGGAEGSSAVGVEGSLGEAEGSTVV